MAGSFSSPVPHSIVLVLKSGFRAARIVLNDRRLQIQMIVILICCLLNSLPAAINLLHDDKTSVIVRELYSELFRPGIQNIDWSFDTRSHGVRRSREHRAYGRRVSATVLHAVDDMAMLVTGITDS